MAHKTKINGTTYNITGGRTKISGTTYKTISSGKTKISGTQKSINFINIQQFIFKGSNSITATYSFETGMTWKTFIDSKYNSAIASDGREYRILNYYGGDTGLGFCYYHYSNYEWFPLNAHPVNINSLIEATTYVGASA